MSEALKKKRLAVLVSGGGTNMQSIIDAAECGEINASVAVVISSNAEAYALKRAEKHNIPSFVCALADYGNSREERDKAILNKLIEFRADYVILAGYLGIVTSVLLERYENKIINIHPALLPEYGGKSFYGLNVHRAVIADKRTHSGATVHFVDGGTDTGLIIAQEKLEVLPFDTPESLQERILNTIEHKLFTRVIKDLCDDKIYVCNGKVVYEE